MPNDGMAAALAAYRQRRKDLARSFRPIPCHGCGGKIAPGDPLWLYDGHCYCSSYCVACACGATRIEDGDGDYLERFTERPADDPYG